ncbi:hypothetical protein EGW08_022140 [Elysia chlorotica]|uniref:Solute carrier organic anion transporter family member n=1 Tax=Elysia chlorotica TaxID=188477 RepID=A0A433SLR7_ELYCH|nr:hypothetical protein EGW08_022140 [Elysia chlorotica]
MAETSKEVEEKETLSELFVPRAPCAVPEDVELEPCLSHAMPISNKQNVESFHSLGADDACRCGYGRWRPDCLQALNRPGVLVAFLASYSFVLGFLVNGVNNVNISSIERRFSLSSTQMGLTSSFFDISGSTVALILGYFGSGKRKPRLLVITTFISAMGSLLMSSPHFLTESYKLGTASNQLLCNADSVSSVDPSHAASAVYSFGTFVFFIFALSQLLHGVGGTALFTVGASLLDDSVEAQRTPLFLGFIYGANIIGSGIGYFVGGQLLQVYVDVDIFGSGDGAPEGLTNEDTRWVGAWWIGPFLAGLLQILLCLPLSVYGFELPQARKVRQHRVSQAHCSSGSSGPVNFQPSFSCASLRQWAKLSWGILKNPCFTFVTLGMTTEAMFVSGSAAFLPKIVENDFNINASMAAFIAGLTVMPAAIFGLMFGGYLAKRFKFTITDILKFTISFCSLGALGCLVLWIKCEPTDIYGVHRHYKGHDTPLMLLDSCNQHCHCETNLYEPICSQEAGIFFSPCFAGCATKNGHQYSDCSCANQSQVNISGFKESLLLSSENCRQSCYLLWIFAPLLFLSMCATFMPIAPCDSVQLRCVPEEHKLYAQGMKTLVIRLLGSFMGPIVMGRLLDSSCGVWREKCGNRLSCWIYNSDDLILSVFLFVTSLKVCTIIFTSLALYLYRPPSPTPLESKQALRESGAGGLLKKSEISAANSEGVLESESMVNPRHNPASSGDGIIFMDQAVPLKY